MRQLFTGLLLMGVFILHAQSEPLSLEDCVNMALEKNISIKQSELDVQNAGIDKLNAFGNFLPTVNLSASHFWNNGLNQNITTGLLENVTTEFSSFQGNVGVDIFKGLQNINQYRRAQLNLLAQQYRLADMADDVSLFVANAYLQVVLNKEILTVQQKQIETTQLELKRTKELVEAGVLTARDLYELEANLATQEQSLVVAENNFRLGKINLAQLLLITDYENFEIELEDFSVPFPSILEKQPKEIFEQALTFRNDVKLAETNIGIAQKDLDIAKGALYPRLSGFYSYSTRITYNDRLVGTGTFSSIPLGYVADSGALVVREVENSMLAAPLSFADQFSLYDGHNFGLQLSIPVFNGKSLSNAVKRSKVNLQRSKNLFSQQQLDLETSVNQAFNDSKGSYKLYEAALKTENATRRAADDALERFQAGAMNSFDYVQAKQRYEAAVSEAIRAKFDYVFKLKVVEFYFGLPLEIN
ncbi:MAG: TolC family protein [Flavobacteriaceae bacterium]|nr:TolC family protein [Flavobacteriaceae bacterium]